MMSLSSEFLNVGIYTTSTVLQWIMANLVKYPHIEEKLFMEIKGVVGEGEEEKRFVLNDLLLPKKGIINFMVAEMGLDPKVWEDPMAFKPERFLTNDGSNEFDITGSKEIKMMPFGARRRICPGIGLAMLHLEYFVANLVWSFDWKAVVGDDVDLSKKQEFTIVSSSVDKQSKRGMNWIDSKFFLNKIYN
ncbi:hypothetical protein CRYUN_Cryun16bG0048200 [Craigia yunnanensis]